MFWLTSDIVIGNRRFKPASVSIKKSMNSYRDHATIKVPSTARLKAGQDFNTRVETASQFKDGDPVTIKLGYNGSLKTEFVGFVSRINFTSPLEIECEGYSYKLRKKTDYQRRTFKNVELKDLLKFLVQGTGIELAGNIPGFKIEKFVIDGRCGTEYLEEIKKLSAKTLVIYFDGPKLYAGMMYLQAADPALNSLKPANVVKYRLGWNVIKDNQLKLREAKNEDVTVNFIGEKRDGTKEQVIVNGKKRLRNATTSGSAAGVAGETKIYKTHHVTDRQTLTLLAHAKQERMSYDGYEGKITAFLVPFCAANWMAQLTDNRYPERSGTYLVVGVEITYGRSGARRIVELGKRIYT